MISTFKMNHVLIYYLSVDYNNAKTWGELYDDLFKKDSGIYKLMIKSLVHYDIHIDSVIDEEYMRERLFREEYVFLKKKNADGDDVLQCKNIEIKCEKTSDDESVLKRNGFIYSNIVLKEK